MTWDLGQSPLQRTPTAFIKGCIEMGVTVFPSCVARMGAASLAPEALLFKRRVTGWSTLHPLPLPSACLAWLSQVPCLGLLLLPLSTVEEPGAAPEQQNDAGAAKCGRDTGFQGLQEMPIVSQLCHNRGESIPISLCIISRCIKQTVIFFLPP